MPSVTEITVRYAETDCMGVTHHAVYPVWFEVARTDYIKNAAVSYAEMERRGYELDMDSVKDKNNIKAVYFKNEIGGFAVHLLQK